MMISLGMTSFHMVMYEMSLPIKYKETKIE